MWIFLVCAAMVGLDQLVKYLVVSNMQLNQIIPVVPGILNLRYIQNDGAAFSFLAGKQIFLIIATSVALLAIAYILWKHRPKNKAVFFGFVLILAGGVGNWIDRVLNGYVVDYFEFAFVNFAIFNLADTFVTVGLVLFLAGYIYTEIKAYQRKKLPDEGEAPLEDQSKTED